MSADPDDNFTLDIIAPAAPRVEMSEAEKAKAKIGDAFKARLLGFMAPSEKPRAWRREPVLVSPDAPNEPPRPRDSGKLDSARLDLAIDLPEGNLAAIDPAEILAEASSESRRAPTYEELWREPRRLAASISVAPAPRDRVPGWAAVVAILMGVSALIALREKIVDVAPPAAKAFAAIGLPVNLAGLELREVRSHIEMDGARKVLAVEGEIANVRRESRSVPPVALTVRGEDGQAKYAWTTRAAKSRLEPGETIAFRARLASPPESGAEVLVRFSSLEEAVGRPGVAAR
ncbi:MAG TPA: hypothetical protein VIF61_10430 [Methylocystis sp.]